MPWPFPFPPGTPPFRARRRFPDVEALRAASGAWRLEFLQLGPWDGEAVSDILFTGRSLLVITAYPGAILVRGTLPAGSCTISTPLLAGSTAHHHGRAVPAGHVAVQRQGGDVAFHSTGPLKVLAATFDEEVFGEIAGPLLLDCLRGGRGRSFQVCPARTGEPLEAAARRIMAEAWPVGEPGPPAQRAGRLDRLVLEALFEGAEPYRRQRPDPGRLVMARQLERLLRQRQRGEVSVAGLCRELGIPARTVQQGFREAFGCSPRAYLSLLRLNAGRAELAAPTPGTRVSEAAARCGLTHLGRFSLDYRRLFGESPRATLARARAALPGAAPAARPSRAGRSSARSRSTAARRSTWSSTA